jgi:phasin family protein
MTMSQKPKVGMQQRPASVIRPPQKVVETKVVETKVVETKAAPVAPEPVQAPVVPVPVVAAEPVVEMVPAAASEPVAYEAIPTVVTLPETVSEPMAATAAAVTEAIATTADSVPAVIQSTKPALTQGMKTMMKSTEDLVAFGQANMEAFVKSSQIWSAGVQELTKQFATTAKASFEESMSTFKAITTAKSVKEAMDLQTTFAKAALEKAMAESNKLTDASIKLTEQTLAPITARVTMAVETFGKAA